MTVTGSIGIFYGKFDVSGLLAKLGITTETYKRGSAPTSRATSGRTPTTSASCCSTSSRYMYGRFVGAVAEGRKMTKDEVDAVGRGHVCTGEQAKPIELVDRVRRPR